MVSGPAGFLFLSSLFLSLSSFLLLPSACRFGKRESQRTDQCVARCFLFGSAHPHYKNLPFTQAQLTPLFDPVIVSLCIAIKAYFISECIFQQSIWWKRVLTLEHLLIRFLSAKSDQRAFPVYTRALLIINRGAHADPLVYVFIQMHINILLPLSKPMYSCAHYGEQRAIRVIHWEYICWLGCDLRTRGGSGCATLQGHC